MSELEPTRTYSNHTATEVLRRLLDERGVEHEGGKRSLRWRDRYGVMMQAFPLANGELGMGVWSCTPEQAIAATLGATDARPTQEESSETCHDEGDPSDFCCSECGVRMFTDTSDTYTMIASDGRTIIKHPNYCPNCGRRVEQ